MLEDLVLRGIDYHLSYHEVIDGVLAMTAADQQSAHKMNTIINVYSKFANNSMITALKQVKKGDHTDALREELWKILLRNDKNNDSEFTHLFLELVKQKLQDCRSNTGQGDSFIKKLLQVSNSDIKIVQIKNTKYDEQKLWFCRIYCQEQRYRL